MTTPRSDFGYPTEYTGLGVSSLRDVDLLGLADGNVLVWNETREVWDVGAVAGANELNDLSDVNIAGPVLNQALVYDGSEWTNQAQGAIPLGNLTDVTLAAPSNSQVLTYNGTVWVNANLPTNTLAGLTDTDINTAANNEVLVYNGTDWANTDSVTLNSVTGTTVTGTTITDGTVVINAGAISAATDIQCSSVTVLGTVFAANINGTQISDGTLTITNGEITNVADITTEGIVINKGVVTQTPNPDSVVTLNTTAGIITTASQTLTAGTNVRFTVNCNQCFADSLVIAQICEYDPAATGNPKVFVGAVAAGSFTIDVSNVDPTLALNNVLKIAFVIH